MSVQSHHTFDDSVRPAGQCFRTKTPSNTVGHRAEPVRVARLPDPALAQIIKLRGQGFGWEDICVLLQRDGILVSKSDVRRFILGPKRTTASAGATTEAVKLGQTQN